MAERSRTRTSSKEADDDAAVTSHKNKKAIAAIRADYTRVYAACEQIDKLVREKRALITDPVGTLPEGSGDVARQLAETTESVRRMMIDNEERIKIVESELLQPVHDHAYLKHGGTTGRQGDGGTHDESMHVPPMQDLRAIENMTGVAEVAEYGRQRATLLYAYQPNQ